jgi:Zn-dependent M16 (insulinase) family peptidase
LPTLTLDDIQRKLPNPINLKVTGDANSIYYNEQDTNGIVYVTSYTPISTDLPTELRKYVPLFAHVLTKIGARDMNHTKLAEEIELHTGGISARPLLIPNLKGMMK